MYDDWNDVDYSIPHHVGDVWADDNANSADGCSRRLLRGSRDVLSTRRGAEGQKKKKALNRPKYQRQRKILRF